MLELSVTGASVPGSRPGDPKANHSIPIPSQRRPEGGTETGSMDCALILASNGT